ncbi:3-deoxy-7-phosphoheptulonate synthase [Streptomyces yaizuensis]|uniref:Phospho-2-dehydro-3-deoxyheptonate aldolase n=1 Tax=Streptomyces yaizuensis TaxID=2989713 RepID=A0ABQ5PB10_9ACTN|nr:3-deoxy-7-phosphoheptulonate synthase [Streptomyces sp. YSPA8]GLF99411.1 3-deoxy-7-phosphoheptulonate synthase [Streptomyces sp. YSPA8]
MDNALLDIRSRTAQQQPDWDHDPRLAAVRAELARRPALVRRRDVLRLRTALARVARGEAHVVLAGDCSEDPAECTAGDVARKAGLLHVLAGTLMMTTHTPVLRVGRIAGQFTKPRSRPTEHVGGVELPVYRGHMVNGPEPDAAVRAPDPTRILTGYRAAAAAMDRLGWGGTDPAGPDTPVWTSHEALLLDYEIPLLRRTENSGSSGDDGDGGDNEGGGDEGGGDGGGLLLGSTHWPWIGERTRDIDGAHVALLATVVNPVACKVGPTITPDELVALCARLDPHREPGRLTLVARMGEGTVARVLPPLVAAVRAAGHPVIWLTDPLHGNTVATATGLKTRYVDTVVAEIQQFQTAVRQAGGVAGGLHLETTPDEVTECVTNASHADHVAEKYTSFCDPRLNPAQATAVVAAWLG